MKVNLLKSLVHNVGVVIVGFAFALVATGIDSLLGIHGFRSTPAQIVGSVLVATGFVIRVWATFLFYQRRMAVIKLAPQHQLITSGPFSFSRNPLYLGGNVFIFLGAVLFVGTPSGIALTAVNIFVVDSMIRREEEQLSRVFGGAWLTYRNRVRRWL